ncbi:MAG: CsiV family protein [Sulfurifustaceae bacterium]
MRSIVVFVAALLVSASAFAAPASSYEIEVLVFETKFPEWEASELWTHVARPAEAATTGTEALPPTAEFSSMISAFRADSHYRVLLHKHWVQPAESKGTGTPVPLTTPDKELNGGIKFYLSRFLHLELNVAYQPQPGPVGGVDKSADNPPTYIINEQRRIKSNELNYFDHPKFGVLVRVTPVTG